MGITAEFKIRPDTIFPKLDIYENDHSEHEIVTFDETTIKVCVGIVDIIGSTRITARLTNSKLASLYSIFLNTIGSVITRYEGHIIKNIGDSILYYFPDGSTQSQFIRCLECNLAILQVYSYLNSKLKTYDLPKLDYRISSDYGDVAIAETVSGRDIFGQPVNICSKINRLAQPNSFVIGSDFFQLAKTLECYKFEELKGYSSGLRFSYPVYAVSHDDYKLRRIVGRCIEKTLMEMSPRIFEKVVEQLFEKHSCFLSDCYERPQYLKETLKDLYGNASKTIIENIEKQIEWQSFPKPVREFIFQLGH